MKQIKCFGHPTKKATHIVKLPARRPKQVCKYCAENAKKIPNSSVRKIK